MKKKQSEPTTWDEWMSIPGSIRGQLRGNPGVFVPSTYVDDKGDWDILLSPSRSLEDKIIGELVTALVKMGCEKEAMDKLYDYAVATNRINHYPTKFNSQNHN